MAIFSTAATFLRLERSQWLDRSRLAALQAAKLRRLVDHAYRTVPFYRAHFDQAGVRPEDIRRPADLSVLPPVTKDALRDAGLQAVVSSAFDPAALSADRTSGSTGTPFTVMRDRHFVTVRKAHALRVLRTMGYRPGDRVLTFVRVPKRPPAAWSRWRYLSIDAAPEQLLREVLAFRPALIFGFTTTFRQLAHLIDAGPRSSYRARALLSSGELFDEASRALVSAAFGAQVFDAYAMTEMGVVAWECQAHHGFHVAEDTAVLETEPVPGTSEAQPILTNLELMAMPFIRYATGDLVTPGPPETCSCGRRLMRLSRIEGRVLDSIVLADGRSVSPFRFTTLLQQLPLRRYQLVQEDLGRFRLRLSSAQAVASLADRGRAMVRQLAGADAQVEVSWEDDLDPPFSVKFRAVESWVARSNRA